MTYETALALKTRIVGSFADSLSGVLAEAAEKLQIEGEIDLGLERPDDGRVPEIWVDCNPR